MLPEPGAPLVLADGTKIDPKTGKPIKDKPPVKYVEVPANGDAQRQVTQARRRLADLPDVPQKMNVISVILTYSLFGLNNGEIALATNLTEAQVGTVKMSDAYAQMQEVIVNSIAEQDGDNIRSLFRRSARKAAEKVEELIDSENEAIALAAAKDALDRDGHRPNDVVEHRHKMEGGLTIEYVKTDKTQQLPVIDLEIG